MAREGISARSFSGNVEPQAQPAALGAADSAGGVFGGITSGRRTDDPKLRQNAAGVTWLFSRPAGHDEDQPRGAAVHNEDSPPVDGSHSRPYQRGPRDRICGHGWTFPFNPAGIVFGPSQNQFAVQGQPHGEGDPTSATDVREVSASYFETIGRPIMRGRAFTQRDCELASREASSTRPWLTANSPVKKPLGSEFVLTKGKVGRKSLGSWAMLRNMD